jgi:hypothetical protein
VTTKVSGKLGIKGGWFCTYHAGLTNGRILERSGGTVCCKPGSHRPGLRKTPHPLSDERPKPLATEELPTMGFRR